MAALAACLAGGRAHAANRYWSGVGTWNAANANWGAASGGPYASTWSNTAPDAAIFEGTAGTVTLAMTATTNGMTFSTTGYTVTGGTIALNGTIAVGPSISGTIESKFTGGNAFTKGQGGTLRLTNTASDFTGTILAGGGVLELAVIPNSATNRINFNGGIVRYIGATNTTTNRALQIGTVGGSIQARLESSGAGTINYSSPAAATAGGGLTAGAGVRLGGSNTGDNYWRGILNDLSSTPMVLSKIDAGTWIVTGNSGYTGGTTIGSGTLGFGSTTALGTGTVSFSGNATLRAAVTGTLSNILSTGASSAVTATVDTQANAVTLSGSIGGSGNFTKTGVGRLTLSGVQTFTGVARVDAGTLVIGDTNTLATASRIVVASGATLDATAAGLVVGSVQTLAGSGTVAGGLTIAAGATLSPGNSPGTLVVTGSTLWGGNGNYNWQLYTTAGGVGTGWDFLDSSGSLDITATGGNPFTINMWSLSGLPDTTGSVSDFNPASPSNFLIAEFDGGITGWDPAKFSVETGAANGTGGFQNAPAGGMFTVARGDSVLGGNANQIYIVYAPGVPEPGSLALGGIGLAAAACVAHRRRRTSR